MKGYGVLFCLAALLLWLMPLGFQAVRPTAAPTATTETQGEESFTVAHTADPAVTETMSAADLTLFETIASIAPDAPLEAIKAQAVACYTALCYRRDVAAAPIRTTLSFPEAYTEAYWTGIWGEQAEAHLATYRTALEAVRGQRVTFNGQPIMAVYHVMNAGKTEEASVLWGDDLPYLRSVASPADALRVDLHTTVTVPTAEAEAALKTLCQTEAPGEPSTWFGEAERTEAGTVKTITVCGKPLEGRQLRDAFSLPSAAFEVQVQDGQVLFTVSGNGHFVGMSVCGAVAMAEDGAAYDAILKHYYTGVELT